MLCAVDQLKRYRQMNDEREKLRDESSELRVQKDDYMNQCHQLREKIGKWLNFLLFEYTLIHNLKAYRVSFLICVLWLRSHKMYVFFVDCIEMCIEHGSKSVLPFTIRVATSQFRMSQLNPPGRYTWTPLAVLEVFLPKIWFLLTFSGGSSSQWNWQLCGLCLCWVDTAGWVIGKTSGVYENSPRSLSGLLLIYWA